MVNVPKFHSLDIIFINVSYPYFLSSCFFLVSMHVNLFKIEMHNKFIIALSLTCDLPKYACHYMIINCIFPTKSAEQWSLRVALEKCKYSVNNYERDTDKDKETKTNGDRDKHRQTCRDRNRSIDTDRNTDRDSRRDTAKYREGHRQ